MTALRERREALELLSADATRACAGSGRLVLLRGATGTGRTALLDAATTLGAEQGMRVLRARCAADEPGAPFATIRQLLDPRPDFDSAGIPRTTPHQDFPTGCGNGCCRTPMTPRCWWPWTTPTSPTPTPDAGSPTRPVGWTRYRCSWW